MTWMKKLALHYENMKNMYPEDKLMILFDIEGTILDMRYSILHILKSFDENHGTQSFKNLKLEAITVHENQVEKLLIELNIQDENLREKILDWYNTYRWSPTAILTSHRPFVGVMEVIRWFQMQPNTYVALNTGKPDSLRKETLRSINRLGDEYKVHFTDQFLHMNPNGWDQDVINIKVAAVNHFRKVGYRVFAMVDNEPENLDAASKAEPQQEILFLHADTIFESQRKKLPTRVVSGKVYDITELIHEKALPQHIQFVWHGVNDAANLRQFLSSSIQWAECDIRLHPQSENIILRHDSFEKSPLQEGEEIVFLKDILLPLQVADKSIKLDLKENDRLIDQTLELLAEVKFEESHLWFNGNIEVLKEKGFRKVKKLEPSAIIQCPIDHVTQLILNHPDKAKEILFRLNDWGINRLSINWNTPYLRKVLDRIDHLGFNVNIYNVPDLECFLKTVLFMPRSITADFNFPKWYYYGRGAGQNQQHHEYALSKSLKND